ncbi:glycogen/starch/alpha-glucan family phosphorylase [Pasteurella skyensis]|uniref:glycogen/starch/alpha-glucan family phosphorylase n=1 Tax=Phocoenobacter skyensis TaxID=97481 RepID=UPI0027786F1B|nr:glycogen/starch/alpha-glucan family phosphorylase [Pasteurella skyensis]MDP8176103.1 glycogen/starch/alpha-glucan family phosphorylase [Pasteurella skyensis]MDP8198702.1 glycogen/starch/alpha-glucan family phosphorylase [Pasteurella skyensis]
MSFQQQFKTLFTQSLDTYCKTRYITPQQLTETQWYQLIAKVSQEAILQKDDYKLPLADTRHVNYLSMEFLVGRLLGNNLQNLELYDVVAKEVAQYGVNLVDILEQETDPALGNGGLGRLAACYLDSMASLAQPATGYGLHYQYGLFKQYFSSEGQQKEEGDAWNRDFYPQQQHHSDFAQLVKFGGEVTPISQDKCHWKAEWYVKGEAFDLPVVGYKGVQQPLRLWQGYSEISFDLAKFDEGKYLEAERRVVDASKLTKVLYPNDNHQTGKILRLMQQYFHCACSVGDIIKRHLAKGRKLEQLAEFEVIQLNDTHPAIAIPELMRVLLDEYDFSWQQAWQICSKTFAYTNHTLLPEALEQWDQNLLASLLPRHFMIIDRINNELYHQVKEHFSEDEFAEIWQQTAILFGYRVRMANLCVVGSFAVNGVAKIHSDLVVSDLFPAYARLFKDRFYNVTNGVTPRRWIRQANPLLSQLLDQHIEGDWTQDLSLLQQIEKFAKSKEFQTTYAQIKQANKERLAARIKDELGLDVDTKAIFDVQIKRFHEYKRQQLNLLNIIATYQEIKANPTQEVVPRVFIFAGKAAPGYFMAKQIIYAINNVAKVINSDPDMQGKLQVIFLPDYRVSLAEIIIPAADVSEQISLAGKEASGTGNMKLALNGAITLGTLDGANVEIADYAGSDNVVIFGHTVDSINQVLQQGYNPKSYYESDKTLAKAIDALKDGTFSEGDKTCFKPLVDELLNNDHFCTLADFASYRLAQQKIANFYQDRTAWLEATILNTARLGIFSSDRSIQDYQAQIWKTIHQ